MLSNQSIITILLPPMVAGLVALLINWRIHRGMEGVGYWPLGAAVTVVGGGLRALEGALPDFVSVIVGGLLIIGGQFVSLYGLSRFAGVPMFTRSTVAVLTLLVAGTSYFTWVAPDTLARTIVFTSAFAASLILQTHALWVIGRREGYTGVIVLAGVYIVGLSVLTYRLVAMSTQGTLPSLDFSVHSLDGPAQFNQIVVFIYATVLVTLRTYGYILLSTSRLQLKLRQTATVDDLTGLPNRRAFDEEMRRIVPRIRRDGVTFGLAVMDIDHFKRINDTHGHAIGDAMLKHFAGAVRKVLRDSDFFARTGGEEFVLVATDTSAVALRQAAERIRHALEHSPLALPTGPLGATISAGLAVSATGQTDYQAVYKRADDALYRAKAAGRNRIEPTDLENSAQPEHA